jgi:hypothetical protein
MVKKIKNVGEALLNHAEEVESSRRGVADDLFPYIYVAAKKMSTRAISRWLEESQGIKLSAATISKVLRESDLRMRSIYELMKHRERDLYSLTPNDLPPDGIPCSELFNLAAFEYNAQLQDGGASLFGDHPEDMPSPLYAAHETRIILYNELHREWFALPQEFREDCKKFAAPYELGSGARP